MLRARCAAGPTERISVERIVVDGGRRLQGTVRVSGAKNAALPLLFAGILNGRETVLRNVPRLWDTATARKLLTHLGADVDTDGNTVFIDSARVHNLEATYDLVSTMRASVLVLGPLVARFGQARVSLPGGCAIGARPVDQHIKVLEALGARIEIHAGYLYARGRRLRGTEHRFDLPTVGGTEQALMAAVFAEGTTVLHNCAREPEIVDLAAGLNAMGARIRGAGDDVIEIQGVADLGALDHTVIPDRIEAGTLAAAAAMTGGDVTLTHVNVSHLGPVVPLLQAAGADVSTETAGPTATVRVRAQGRPRGVTFETAPWPAFPTDMQAQFMAMAAVADGESTIRETVFENRFLHAAELNRLGAAIRIEGGHTARVKGVARLEGAVVTASDLRASAALVLGGLVADGTTVVRRAYHLFRGYENLDRKLSDLGGAVRREADA